MNIAIAGISGFTGSELKKTSEKASWKVTAIPRALTSDKSRIQELTEIVTDADVIINLSGAPIIKRHTNKYRQILWESRIVTTQSLVRAIELSAKKPELLISLSATGIYKAGHSHDEFNYVYDDGFLGTLCMSWENEAMRAETHHVRTVILRTGIILGEKGGIIKKLSSIFKLGLGAVILPPGSPFPWVHISDFTEICMHMIRQTECRGVYNLSANENTTQRDFAKAFAKALKKPLLFIVPGFFLKIMFGKGADIITRNASVKTERLREANYEFLFTDIQSAMKDILTSKQD